MQSLPTRERGLKQTILNSRNIEPYVAPYAGAWIETSAARAFLVLPLLSLPTRERGLKHAIAILDEYLFQSLPTRERGLKRKSAKTKALVLGRSLRGSVD